MKKNIKIIVATHKKYKMPVDEIYLPMHVGADGKESLGYIKDNSSDNISYKNPYFCELTGLYWAWKNINADYIGLVHYRRHFIMKKKSKDKFENILNYDELNNILEKTDVLLPRKRHYVIENLYDHYAHTMYIEPLEITGNIINEKYPEYSEYFEKLHKRTSAHMFNMFVMKKEIFNEYCKWLFDILFELESRVDSSKYNEFHARFYGRISELLLDVYIQKNNIPYKEVGFIYMEKINKIVKIRSFLRAKFKGEKYGRSF